jgi:LPS-assembly lipoprotein
VGPSARTAGRIGTLVAAGALALAGLVLVGLGGCGFTPLYATPGVGSGLAGVEVITPEGRTGQLLGETLKDDLASGRTLAPRYRLALAVDETRYARGLSTEQVATWYELSVKVSYSLIDLQTGRTLTAGQEPVSISYNAMNDPYAGLVAQQDGQKRAATEAAQRIRIALASYFAKLDEAR